MVYRALLKLPYEQDYRDHYKQHYLNQSPIKTFDDIGVSFKLANLMELIRKDPGPNLPREFCPQRAERLDWIKVALQDAGAGLYFGYDHKAKVVDYNRRIAIVDFNYAVIIRMTGEKRAAMLTAYPMDSGPLALAKSNPVWT